MHPIVGIFTGVVKGTRDNATDNVNRALDKLGKRLIVFIDDFDRLVDVEIIEVLKLIDKNAAFRHTIFITAYDEGAVSKALKRYASDKDIEVTYYLNGLDVAKKTYRCQKGISYAVSADAPTGGKPVESVKAVISLEDGLMDDNSFTIIKSAIICK